MRRNGLSSKRPGVCYTDVHQTEGELHGHFPRILGHEVVGEIVTLAYERVRQGQARFRAVLVN